MSTFKEALQIYKENFFKILLMGVTLILPLELVALFISNLFESYYSDLNLTSLAILVASLMQIVIMAIIQLPFIHFVYQHVNGKEVRFKDAYLVTMENAFSIYVVSILYILLIVTGTTLLILPGLIVFVLFFLFPYSAMIEQKFWWSGLKQSFFVAKENFFKLIGIIFVFGGLQWLVEIIFLYGSFFVVDRFIFLALIQIGVSSLLFPLFVILLSLYYMKWIDYDPRVDFDKGFAGYR